MSKPAAKIPVNRERIRERLKKIHQSRRRGRLGRGELIGLIAGAVLLFAVVVGYLYFLVPARSRAAALLLERDRLQKQLRSTQRDFQSGVDAKVAVQKITESLETFDTVKLIDRGGGRMVLYEELNQLIKKNGLRNTSGPTYTGLDPLITKGGQQVAANSSNSAAAKWQSLYPGIAVNVTVEGQYQNLRHFVQDIERSKEFTIINAVELERATESNSRAAVAESTLPLSPKSPTPAAGNALVSLRLDLSTYFQRQGSADKDSGQVPADR